MKGSGDALTELNGSGLLAQVHEELGDLVSIHARRGYLDSTGPVEVVVAEVIGELLDDRLLNWRIIESHVEVSWEDASLSSGLRNKVEVVLRHRVLVLHNAGVNQGSTWRIVESASLVFNEEPLSDPLVDDDHSDERLLLGEVIGLVDRLAKLLDFLLKDLSAHCVSNSISVNDDVLWVVSMALFKADEGSLHGVLELLRNDLLAFTLKNAF